MIEFFSELRLFFRLGRKGWDARRRSFDEMRAARRSAVYDAPTASPKRNRHRRQTRATVAGFEKS